MADKPTQQMQGGRIIPTRSKIEKAKGQTGAQTQVMGKGRVEEGISQNDGNETMMLGREEVTGPLAWLIVSKGNRTGTTYRLQSKITSIGRNGENDIVVSDEAVSSIHAKIRIEGEKYMIYDLVTSNGTKVNGEKVMGMEIVENDRVQIGETELVFKKI
jgi:hypothetical protein